MVVAVVVYPPCFEKPNLPKTFWKNLWFLYVKTEKTSKL